jgi:hypothetical protein
MVVVVLIRVLVEGLAVISIIIIMEILNIITDLIL